MRHAVAPLPAIDPFETDILTLRVWPNDIDFNFHLNNARHLSVMDYGRIHQMARVGLLKPVFKARWTPVVGTVWITYRRSLPLFSAFTLSSRLVCWDDRWFYIEQKFAGEQGLAAIGWVKGMLRDKRGAINPQDPLSRVAPGIASPPIPESIAQWNELTREKLNVPS